MASARYAADISIPPGPIEAGGRHVAAGDGRLFQFLLVRLKPRLHYAEGRAGIRFQFLLVRLKPAK